MGIRLKNKVVIVTGGGQGIGKQVALLLASEGASVVVADINGFNGDDVVDQIMSSGGEGLFINSNVSVEKDCKSLIELTEQQFGKVNVLINNAGFMHEHDGDIVHLEERIWNKTFVNNVNSVYFCCKYAIPSILRANGGSIINVSSFVALRGSADAKMAYTASKGAIVSLTRDLAAKYSKFGIRVNTLCPGPTRSESFMATFKDNDERLKSYLGRVPIGRFAESLEIASAILFLASEDSSYITGTEFVVDGGITTTYMS